MAESSIFELRDITKSYPGVVANDHVSFSLAKSSIHALLGENGAGKSTLVKIMYGLVSPSEGEMRFDGQPYAPHKPQEARALGMGMVFQHFSLFEALSVAENIAVGMEDAPARQSLKRDIRSISESYGLPLDPDAIIGNLSAGERQRVEIIRSLLQNPKLLIMDEPTSVLTPGEVETLFLTLRKLRDEGVSILYISHKLDEIRALCDWATIMRRGKVVGECDPAQKSSHELAEMMVGQSLAEPKARKVKLGEKRLVIEGAATRSEEHFGTNLRNIALELSQGEILGIAGVAGNGQDELMEMLSGELPLQSGSMKMDGEEIGGYSVKKRRAMGLISAPEERLGHAAVPAMSLIENAMLTGENRAGLSRKGWLNWARARAFADEVIKVFDVRTPSADVAASALSGGNLQKFVIGREVLQRPEIFVVNQPSWGVDAAAAGFIRQSIRDLADEGAAVIVISQDLDEIFELADHVMVIHEGVLSKAYEASALDTQTIGQLMGGAL